MSRSFGQADGVIGISIDERVQNRAVRFVKNHQNADGCFPTICNPIHKELQGCSSGNCSVTAYVILAVLEAGICQKVNKTLPSSENAYHVKLYIG